MNFAKWNCDEVRDRCAACGKSCKLIDLVWDKFRRKVVCPDCDTAQPAPNQRPVQARKSEIVVDS